jgi:hypothetical protein
LGAGPPAEFGNHRNHQSGHELSRQPFEATVTIASRDDFLPNPRDMTCRYWVSQLRLHPLAYPVAESIHSGGWPRAVWWHKTRYELLKDFLRACFHILIVRKIETAECPHTLDIFVTK